MEFGTPLRRVAAERALEHYPPQRIPADGEYARLAEQARAINNSPLKRSIDITISTLLILFFLPALIAIAAAIKISSPGPVFFRQRRYGTDREVFCIFKFRTMCVMEADGAFQQAARGDVRVTRIGAWLRRSSMDELPQLLNVLAGDMSLIGPRPHALAMDDYYAQIIPDHAVRHLVRPGLTGLAQVNGYRGPTDEIDAMEGRIANDVDYIRDWSLMRDIKILLRTPGVLFGSNAF
jgi:putative colanic acid biosysnthesis UDP-glucose lipid carrier transferase